MGRQAASGRGSTIRPRRIEFANSFEDMPRHFMDGDLVMSHVLAVLSSMFPDGEEFFVRSVRNLDDRIHDPELKARVRGFVGQESVHGREHRQFNAHLAAMGYPTRAIERTIDWVLRLAERHQPRTVNLAVTAALEHYTATLAELLMESEDARALFGSTAARDLLLWHALEESEHKAVAFDVYQEVGGGHGLRVAMMNLTSVMFVLELIGWTAWSLLLDPATRDLRRLGRSLARLRQSPWLTRESFRRLRAYNRRGFHPDDRDATAPIERWRTELFGESGTLIDRLVA